MYCWEFPGYSGLIPGQETKIPTSCTGWQKKKKKKCNVIFLLNWFTSLRHW